MGKRHAIGLFALAMASFGTLPVSAAPDIDRTVAVVELFTSQGCDSCPKADALLGELANRGDVVALSFHVDYWDYLGWKDTLATAENTQRQRDYSSLFGNRSVYTPQIVINGVSDVKGSKPARVDAVLRRTQMGGALPVDVALEFTSDSLMIDVGAGKRRAETALVIVYFDERRDVAITQGKNRGKSFTYLHPVTGFHSAGMWEGQAQHLQMPLHDVQKKGRGGVAVLVQEIDGNGLPGAILGAALIHHPAGS